MFISTIGLYGVWKSRISRSSACRTTAVKNGNALNPVKEIVLLRNVRAAPICDHFAVVPPSSRIREPVPFLV